MNNDIIARILARRQAMLAPDSTSATDTAADDDLIDVQFNRLGGTRVTPIAPVRPWAGEPIPARPTVEIVDWQPRQGLSPLTVSVSTQLAGGPATELRFVARGPVDVAVTIERPPSFATYLLKFSTPGTYALTAQVTGPGGSDPTQDERLITVTKQGDTVPTPYPDEKEYWEKKVIAYMEKAYADASHALDWGAFKWTARIGHSLGVGRSEDAAFKRHMIEMRGALGLKPDPQLGTGDL